MVLTLVMFFVLIACYAAMWGLVTFSENVIAKPQLVPLDNAAATRTANTRKSRKRSTSRSV